MASNTSQRRIQTILLSATVRDYASWSLLVACVPCALPRSIPLADLPPEMTIMQVLLRMRCRTCGAKVEAALLDNNAPGWRARVVRVWGPGSYG